jgi:hypothetical protein
MSPSRRAVKASPSSSRSRNEYFIGTRAGDHQDEFREQRACRRARSSYRQWAGLVVAARANAVLRNVPRVSVTCYGSAPSRTPTTIGRGFSALTASRVPERTRLDAESLHPAMHLRSRLAEVASHFGDVTGLWQTRR